MIGGQIGLAPGDHLFVGMNGTRWRENGADAVTADLNSRFEWKSEASFLRVTPEIAVSRTSGPSGRALIPRPRKSQARPPTVCPRESACRVVTAASRFPDRTEISESDSPPSRIEGPSRGAYGESRAHGRLDLTKQIQGEIEWDKRLSEGEGSGAEDAGRGRGETSSWMGTARLLRSSLPNIELRRGRVLLETPEQRQEKWISRADVEIDLPEAGVAPLGIERFTLRSFYQRSDRRFSRGGGEEDSVASLRGGSAASNSRAAKTVARPAGTERSTDHAFVRVNGSVGVPFAWDAAFEDQWTHRPRKEGPRNIRRLQKADATFQSQPHSSLDAFLRWESSRDLSWGSDGGGGGFTVRRLGLATLHLYPGRVLDDLSPFSFRFDLSRSEADDGETGTPLPGAGSLLSRVSDPSKQMRSNNGVVEGRCQINAWARLVERWVGESQRAARERLTTHDRRREIESRLELKPKAGLVTLRGECFRGRRATARPTTRAVASTGNGIRHGGAESSPMRRSRGSGPSVRSGRSAISRTA